MRSTGKSRRDEMEIQLEQSEQKSSHVESVAFDVNFLRVAISIRVKTQCCSLKITLIGIRLKTQVLNAV